MGDRLTKGILAASTKGMGKLMAALPVKKPKPKAAASKPKPKGAK